MNTYKMTLEDSVDSMTFDLLEVPIVDKDVEGAVDNTTLDGNIFTDYLWLKKNYVQKWSIMCDDEYSRLRGFYTRQFDNASVPTYKLFYGENISQDRAISGDYILVDNTTERNAPITSFELLGDATQTTYSGKNLFDMDAFLTAGGATYTKNGNVFSLTDMGNLYASPQPLNLTDGETYTFSQVLQTQSSTNVRFDILKNGSVYASCYADQPANLVKTFTADSSTYTIRLNYSTRVYPVLFNSPMLEKSATKTDYEPYVGGTASPNPDYPQEVNTVTGEQTVKIEGKNLFDKDNANILNAYIDASHTSITSNSNNRIIWIPCQPNTTYTLQKLAVGTNWMTRQIAYTTQEPAVGVQTYGMVDMMGNDTSKTYTTGADAKYLVVRIWVSGQDAETLDAMLNSVQIELGNSASEYQSYQGQSLSLNLGKNLLNPTELPKTQVGVTGTYQDGIFSLSGTASVASNFYILPYATGIAHLEAGESLTYYIERVSGSVKVRFLTYFVPDDGSTMDTTWRVDLDAGDSSNTVVKTATKAGTVQYVQFFLESGVTYDSQVKVLVQRGNIANPTWSPYFTPIELAKIGTYQDRIYKDGGKWYIEKQIEKATVGSAYTWNISQASNSPDFYYAYTTGMDSADVSDVAYVGKSDRFSNYGTYLVVSSNVSRNTYSFGGANNKIRFMIQKTLLSEMTSSAVNSFFASNPTTVYYALATPTTTEITNSELVEQLEAILQAHLYTGTNNVSNNAVSPNLAGQMNIGYKLILSEETVLIEPTAVRLTLTDGGIINVCGCRQNVQLTMRETIQ